ncbi:hypothetical protein CROQUDRAFT_707494 [Cronartium quercuum f. sp. fusiforme G11]|uniref:Uncharacterized protein n=1 Tax=Cronartium quercuum f. sp. fusiforme G11 TaxID=708437 RepID=A0A9P6N7B7_9BASI|nr:hypothetical protein CROQUDRAFT_707494 [Cronartium quercuum f. sp. fusiforme G11]
MHETSCSDLHTTANDVWNLTSWAQSDDCGLIGCTCHHDVPLKFANIYKTGEKLYYLVAILEQIPMDFPRVKIGVLYDIRCHFEAHFKKHGLLPQHSHHLSFATSVFHAFVHKWSCQIMYNPHFNRFWGLTDGEGLERLWSFLACLIATNRVSTRLHRLFNIKWHTQYFSKITTMANGKTQLFLNATYVFQKEKTALIQLSQKQSTKFPSITYTSDYLCQQWALEQAAQSKRSEVQDSLQIKLGCLLCLEEEANQLYNLPNNQLNSHCINYLCTLSEDIVHQ